MAFANIKSVFYFLFFAWENDLFLNYFLIFIFQLELVFNTILY